MRLEWVRLEGAGACIDAPQIEASVRSRLGVDPFDPHALRSIEGIVRRKGETWHAQIAVRAKADDANPPLRELESTAADCESLGNAVVLAVALAIDPAAAFSDPAEKPPTAARPVEERKASPASKAIADSRPRSLMGRADLFLASQAGLLPKPSLGIGLGAAAALSRRFELGLRAQALPEVEVSGDPSYAVGLVALTLELCAVARPANTIALRACGGPSAGVLHAAVLHGERTQPGERTLLAAELGLDAAFALTPALSFEVGARAVVPVPRYHFTLEGSDEPLFTEAVVGGIANVGLQLRFGAN